jgi:hypothetical protein
LRIFESDPQGRALAERTPIAIAGAGSPRLTEGIPSWFHQTATRVVRCNRKVERWCEWRVLDLDPSSAHRNRLENRAETERRIAAFVSLGLADFRIRAWTVIRGAYLRSRPDYAERIRALLD